MELVYKYTKQVNGIPKQETVTLWSEIECDIFDVLRRVVRDHYMDLWAFRLTQNPDKLTLAEILEHIRPEMLQTYGVYMCCSWAKY